MFSSKHADIFYFSYKYFSEEKEEFSESSSRENNMPFTSLYKLNSIKVKGISYVSLTNIYIRQAVSYLFFSSFTKLQDDSNNCYNSQYSQSNKSNSFGNMQ